MRKLPILVLLHLLACSPFAQTANNDKRLTSLEPELQKVLNDWKCAGFAVAVVQKNKVIYAKGFGYRDVEHKLPVTANTLFAIGSCTKAFTASLIGMLDEDKQVDIDKPVHTYLPDLAFYNNGMTDNVTLRDMMSHRTGLPRHDFSWYMFSTASRDSLMKRIQYMEPSAGLRDKWQYNNYMFLLQGMVTEKLSGQKWEQNVRSKIFEPLHMSRSNFSISDLAADQDAAIGYYAKGDSLIKKMDYYNINAMGPAGSINSSVLEMSNWVMTWINNGMFAGKQIIPEKFRTSAISSQMIIAPGVPEKETPDVFFANYGFGWFLASYRGHYRVEHGGNIDGFSASTCFYPTDSLGVIVLINQNGSLVPAIVRNLVTDKLLGLPYKNWSADLRKAYEKNKAAQKQAQLTAQSLRKPGTHPSHPLTEYTGLYSHPGYGTIEVVQQGDSLFAKMPSRVFWLRHYHYDIFEPFEKDPAEGIDTSQASEIRFQFNTGLAGDISSFSTALEPTLKPLEFVRKEKEVAVSAEALEKYTGDYELNGALIHVYTKGNTLFVHVPGQPDYELAAVGNDKFNLKVISGYSVQFTKDDQQKIIALSFVQPNGIFKAVRKK